LALRMPWVGKRLAAPAIRKALVSQSRSTKDLRSHVWNVVSQLPSAIVFASRFLWQRYIQVPPVPGFFVYSPANRYALHYHAEQSSNPDSTIELAADRDATGMHRAVISLRFLPRDAESVVKAHELLDQHLQTNGIGRLIYWHKREERAEAVLAQASDGFHQIGTIRMATNPAEGVTDSYGRVFGVSNLFVCSSAVFPTSGQANPTLTLLAFAVRQAEYIDHMARGA